MATGLFRARLDRIVDVSHPLAKLSGLVGWRFLRSGSARPTRTIPILPTRLIAGLTIPKHMHDFSDKVLCER